MSKFRLGYIVCPAVIKQVNFVNVVMVSSFLTPFSGTGKRVGGTVFLKVSSTIHCVALRLNLAFLVN